MTLLQAARNPGKEDNFLFIVDESLTNPTVYITGRTVTFTVTSPTGRTGFSTYTPTLKLCASFCHQDFIILSLSNYSIITEPQQFLDGSYNNSFKHSLKLYSFHIIWNVVLFRNTKCSSFSCYILWVTLISFSCRTAYCLFSVEGESQQSTDTEGSLITTSKSVGNLITLQLKKHAGQWTLKMASTNPYTLKVIGENSMVHGIWPQYEYLCFLELQ